MKEKIKLKKRHILLIIFASVIALIGIAYISINLTVVLSTASHIITPEKAAEIGDYDCILVLGAGVREDGSMSHMLNDRVVTAIDLYNKGASSKIIMSGDHGRNGYDEVNPMKQAALDAGIPDSDVFMDHAGFSTYDSIYRADKIFEADKILIVTQDYHLPRALYIANSFGISADGVCANPREYSGQLMRDIRETVARCKDFISTVIKPEPAYLGDIIPISGDGSVTNDKDFVYNSADGG